MFHGDRYRPGRTNDSLASPSATDLDTIPTNGVPGTWYGEEVPEPERSVEPGYRVRVQGVKAEPHLNGCYALVNSYKKERERYVVDVELDYEQRETIALKRENLYVLSLREVRRGSRGFLLRGAPRSPKAHEACLVE